MGYTTDFVGKFDFNRQLTLNELRFLEKFNTTRRMKRNVDPKYGTEGEFYVDGSGPFGQGGEPNIMDHNEPPSTQPGLWCQWRPTEDGHHLEWDEGEKFYDYVEWLKYLINSVFPYITQDGDEPLVLNGSVTWQGEEQEDRGIICIKDNKVTSQQLEFVVNAECPNCGHKFNTGEER